MKIVLLVVLLLGAFLVLKTRQLLREFDNLAKSLGGFANSSN